MINVFRYNIIKSLFYSYRVCGLKECFKYPIIIGNFSKINGLKNIRIERPVRRSLTLESKSYITIIGCLIIKNGGEVHISNNSGIFIEKNAALTFNGNFDETGHFGCNCLKEITFGKNTLLSWQIQISDSDFHQISLGNGEQNNNKPIIINDNVWVGFNTIILKGVEIASGSIIGAGSVVTKSCLKEKSIYAGNPAKLIKSDIEWNTKRPI